MAKQSRDLAIPLGGAATLHARENLFAVGNLGALNAEVVVSSDGCSSFAINLIGVFNLTVVAEGTIDGVNWYPIAMRPHSQNTTVYVTAISGSTPGVWLGRVGPWRAIRARCSAWTSGAAATTIAASIAQLDNTLSDKIANVIATTQGTSGAATTLTLGAPGAGLRQYVDKIELTRFATAALAANATPVIVSTSLFPGGLAFTLPADGLALGSTSSREIDFPEPLAISSLNASPTIIAPATPNIIWRISAYYKIAS